MLRYPQACSDGHTANFCDVNIDSICSKRKERKNECLKRFFYFYLFDLAEMRLNVELLLFLKFIANAIYIW